MKNWLGNLWLLTKRFFTRDPGGMDEPPQSTPRPNEELFRELQRDMTYSTTGWTVPEAGGLAGLVQNSVAIQHGLCDLCRTMQPIREYRGHFYCDYCGELWRQTYQDEHAS